MTLLAQNEQEVVDFLASRSGNCAKCFKQYDSCIRQINRIAGGIVAGGVLTGLLASMITGPQSGFVVGMGGLIGGGISLGIGYINCMDALNVCLEADGCPPVGGGTGGNPGGCLECVIKE